VIETSIRYNALDKQKHVLNETSAEILEAPIQQIPKVLLVSNSDHGITPNVSVSKHSKKVSPSLDLNKSQSGAISLPPHSVKKVQEIVPEVISKAPTETVSHELHMKLVTSNGVRVSDNNFQDNPALIPVSYSPDTHTAKSVIDIGDIEGIVTEQEYKHTLVSTIQRTSAKELNLTEDGKMDLIATLEKAKTLRGLYERSLNNFEDELAHQTILLERIKLKNSIVKINRLIEELDKHTIKIRSRFIAGNDEQSKIAA